MVLIAQTFDLYLRWFKIRVLVWNCFRQIQQTVESTDLLIYFPTPCVLRKWTANCCAIWHSEPHSPHSKSTAGPSAWGSLSKLMTKTALLAELSLLTLLTARTRCTQFVGSTLQHSHTKTFSNNNSTQLGRREGPNPTFFHHYRELMTSITAHTYFTNKRPQNTSIAYLISTDGAISSTWKSFHCQRGKSRTQNQTLKWICEFPW